MRDFCSNSVKIQKLLSTVFAFIAFIFFSASAGTPFVQLKNAIFTSYGLFESCFPNSKGELLCSKASFSCNSLQQARDAAAAFVLISCIVIAFVGLFGVTRLFFDVLATKYPYKYFFFGASAMVAFFGFLSFVIGFALYDSKFCESRLKDLNNSYIGAMPVLALIGDLFTFLCVSSEYYINVSEKFLFSSSTTKSHRHGINTKDANAHNHHVNGGITNGRQRTAGDDNNNNDVDNSVYGHNTIMSDGGDTYFTAATRGNVQPVVSSEGHSISGGSREDNIASLSSQNNNNKNSNSNNDENDHQQQPSNDNENVASRNNNNSGSKKTMTNSDGFSSQGDMN